MPASGTWQLRTAIDGSGIAFTGDTGDVVANLGNPGAYIPGPTVGAAAGTATCDFESVGLRLNGSTVQTPINSLPVGFTPASAYTITYILYLADGTCISSLSIPGIPVTDPHTGGGSQTIVLNETGASTILLTSLVGLTNTFSLSCGAVADAHPVVVSGGGSVAAIVLAGTFTIVGWSWYFNPATGHFQLASSDPGAPWRLQAAGTFDPPTETSPGVWTPSDPNEPAPSITSITPDTGCEASSVTIVGEGFGDGAVVYLDGTLADNISVIDSTTITFDVPTLADAVYDVTVQNADGQFDTVTNGFTVAEPWWALCVTFDVDGIDITYTLYAQQCTSPGDDWAQIDDPAGGGSDLCGTTSNGDDGLASSSGWYASTAEYSGDVYVLGTTDRPAPPRQWGKLAWATADSKMLGGAPAAACNTFNRLVYPANDYTQGTHYPPIRIYDGLFDRELCRLPPTPSDTVPKAVLAMLAANNTVYVSTFDSGTSSADWRGRVFELSITTGQLTPIGTQFAAGELPYALCWHLGRLWCATSNTIGTAGKVYYFRPGVDTTWTTDYTLSSSSVGGGHSLAVYGGKLYVGTDNASGSRGKVLVRDTSGSYSTSETGSGGTAAVNNGYGALAVFKGNLYAAYWNGDTPAISKIRKYDGSSWSTAYTGASGTLRPFDVLLVDNGVLYAFACANGLTGAIVTTEDGASWTDCTANLLETTARELVPASGVLVL